jgi:hypothetical protein
LCLNGGTNLTEWVSKPLFLPMVPVAAGQGRFVNYLEETSDGRWI